MLGEELVDVALDDAGLAAAELPHHQHLEDVLRPVDQLPAHAEVRCGDDTEGTGAGHLHCRAAAHSRSQACSDHKLISVSNITHYRHSQCRLGHTFTHLCLKILNNLQQILNRYNSFYIISSKKREGVFSLSFEDFHSADFEYRM